VSNPFLLDFVIYKIIEDGRERRLHIDAYFHLFFSFSCDVQALKYIRVHGFSPRVARQGVGQVVVLVASGPTSDLKEAAHEAQLLRNRGVYLYILTPTVTAKDSQDDRELSELASKPEEEFVFSMAHWDIVHSLMSLLHVTECMECKYTYT
jgi:hypothetical protein